MIRFIKKNWSVLTVFSIGAIALILTQLQFIFGWLNTPKDNIYLGTVHHAPDYFNYLSWIIQGEDNILSSTVLYTEENLPHTLTRWQFVLIGKIASLFGIGVIESYQLAVFIFIITFLLSAYFLISLIFAKEVEKRIVAFLFFVSSTTWPIVSFTNQGWQFSLHYFWYNMGNFFSRFGPIPHHLLSNTLLTLIFAISIIWFNSTGNFTPHKKILLLTGIFFFGLMQASIIPTHWLLGLLSLFLTAILSPALTFRVKRKLPKLKESISVIIKNLHPTVVFFAGGIPAIIYIYYNYQNPPYSFVRVWEAWQQQPMDVIKLFYSSGLVVVFAMLGLSNFIRYIKPAFLFTLVFVLLNLIFLLSPVAALLTFTNVRFWPSTLYIFLAALACQGVFFLAKLAGKFNKKVLIFILIIYIVSVIPADFITLKEFAIPRHGDMLVYLPNDAYQSYMYVRENIKKDSLFLVQWPLNESFPALTGRKTFYGDAVSHLTLDSAAKTEAAFNFFGGNLSNDVAEKLLLIHKIEYVLAYANTQVDSMPFLKKYYTNGWTNIYELK